jgi:hypothetical protein
MVETWLCTYAIRISGTFGSSKVILLNVASRFYSLFDVWICMLMRSSEKVESLGVDVPNVALWRSLRVCNYPSNLASQLPKFMSPVGRGPWLNFSLL